MLFNLLGKTLLENSIGALKHHLKKKEVARNTEIECQKDIQIEKIKQSGGSFKDELILVWFLVILSLPLIGETERFMNWAKSLICNAIRDILYLWSYCSCKLWYQDL